MSTQNYKVLVVDDFELARTMLIGVLQKLGIGKIIQAQDGMEAMNKLKTAQDEGNPFDMIFCDWKMPNYSGYELLVHCKKTDDLKNIPFIMVTAEADKPSVLKALTSGATDYLIKPFDAKSITDKVNRLVNSKAA